jgi:hypothetical protein
MIRDFRLSRGFPYPTRSMPPLKLAADEQTVVQLKMKATAGGAIKNLAPRGGTAVREGARWIPLTPEYQLAAERADGSVNLIQAFAVLDEPLEGRQVLKWPEKIEAGQATGRTRLMVPFRPPAEYDVSLECTRLAGGGGVFLGLSIAGRPAILAIDAFPELGGRTGILPRDLGQADRAATLHRTPPILRPDASAAMLVKVRLPEQTTYWVEVEHAGRAVASIRGQIADLDAPPEFQIPMLYGMSLGTQDARIRFADVILRTAE